MSIRRLSGGVVAGLLTLFFSVSEGVADRPLLGIDVVKVKPKGSWTEVTIAIENLGETDAEFQCCTAFLENSDGYAIASLTNADVGTQIHNKAKTPALIGGIAAVGLGLGGAISGVRELGYAAVGLGGASAIAGVVGEGSKEKKYRDLVIDDIMRNHVFPSGLKVAGVVYFPPKKKWPGAKQARQIHLTYKVGGRTQRVSAPVPSS